MTPYSRNNPDRITYFAATDARNKRQPFGIKAKDRAKHMYVIGKTGMGKSTMLENLAIQDIQNGEGLAFVDPHGSSAEKLLNYVPEHRIDDVLYFAPFDMEHPVGFNIMEDVGYDKRHLVVAGLMSTFKKIWVDAWSARMEYILENTLLALLEYPDSTLLDVNKMLVVKEFRNKVVDNITDPIVKAFWTEEFAKYTDRYTQDATPAIQNKIGQFTSNPLIRNIIGQPKSSFDVRKLMDGRKILIINLSKGRMGEKNASLLGSILTTKIYLSAMSRAEESASVQATLPDFYFYVDEFQSIANESFADILSEARKYKLALIIAHQYVEQMEEEVRDAVFGNVGTTIAFRVGPLDAELLEKVFAPHFTAEDIVNLAFAQIYLSLMIDGVGSQPFSAVTLPPIEEPRVEYVDEIIKTSRSRFSAARSEVEELVSSRNAPLIAQTKQTQEEVRRHEERAARNRALNSVKKEDSIKAPAENTDRPAQNNPARPPIHRTETTRAEKPHHSPAPRDSAPHKSQPRPKQQQHQHQHQHQHQTPASLDELKRKTKQMSQGDPRGGHKEPSEKQRAALRDALSSVLSGSGKQQGGEAKKKNTDAQSEDNNQSSAHKSDAPQRKEESRVVAENSAQTNGPSVDELKKIVAVDDET